MASHAELSCRSHRCLVMKEHPLPKERWMEQRALLEGRRILVVEDDFLVAQILCEILEDAGAVVVGPIGWVEEALAFLDGNDTAFDSAILDINLHGEKSYVIADVLVSRNIRFAFATGYGGDALD